MLYPPKGAHSLKLGRVEQAPKDKGEHGRSAGGAAVCVSDVGCVPRRWVWSSHGRVSILTQIGEPHRAVPSAHRRKVLSSLARCSEEK